MMIKNGSKRLFFQKKDLAVMTTKATLYVTLGEIQSPNATNTINLTKRKLTMLKNSLGHFDPQIKCQTLNSSHNVLEGLSSIRKRNEELVEALDHSVARFEQVLAFYQTDAYAS